MLVTYVGQYALRLGVLANASECVPQSSLNTSGRAGILYQLVIDQSIISVTRKQYLCPPLDRTASFPDCSGTDDAVPFLPPPPRKVLALRGCLGISGHHGTSTCRFYMKRDTSHDAENVTVDCKTPGIVWVQSNDNNGSPKMTLGSV
jgi:hypothetical protein